jgi:C4-dicarboxylate transporter
VIGFGLLSTLDVNSGMGKIIGYQILEGFGLGLLFTATTYPILASVSVERTANALALFTFMRSFANVCLI